MSPMNPPIRPRMMSTELTDHSTFFDSLSSYMNCVNNGVTVLYSLAMDLLSRGVLELNSNVEQS